MDGRETLEGIGEWGLATFRPVPADPRGVARKMLGEAVELCLAAGLESGEIDEVVVAEVAKCEAEEAKKTSFFGRLPIAEELADCVIVGCTGLATLGHDVQAVVAGKMSVNRARRWAMRGDGTAQHVGEVGDE